MKLGFRKPSFKRSFSAMTKAAATRSLKNQGIGMFGRGLYRAKKHSAD